MNTENCAAETDAEFYQSLLRAYIDSANDGIFVVCDEMKFHVANHKLASWLGAQESDLTRHLCRLPITQLLGNSESVDIFTKEFHHVLAGHPARFECHVSPPDGEARWVEMSMNRVNLDAGDLVIGVVRDVTARRKAMDELAWQAVSDPLTGLANRREFNRMLEMLVEDAQSSNNTHALLYMDLDQFKVINDTCGHMVGDDLLVKLADAIKEKVRSSDTLARLGGDEFGLLLSCCTVDEAMHTAETLRDTICGLTFTWQGKPYRVGVSIGVCGIDANANAAQVLSYADAACYVAKDKGRNRAQLYFGGKDCTGRRREMEWITRINHALQEDRFELHFQKISPLNQNDPCHEHREILLRMLDEDRQLILPNQFIPPAERYDLMPNLDRWVIRKIFSSGLPQLRQAHAQCATDGLQCPLMWTINLSGKSLGDEAFMDFIKSQFQEHAPPPGSICFEITETAATNNLPQTLRFMETFRQFGCQFALDDFGSGVSSFSYLKNLPVDILKIDGSLIQGVASNRVGYAMVEAIQHVAKELRVKTIAEYVEDQATLDALRKIGIDYAQGYAIHKPEPFTAGTARTSGA